MELGPPKARKIQSTPACKPGPCPPSGSFSIPAARIANPEEGMSSPTWALSQHSLDHRYHSNGPSNDDRRSPLGHRPTGNT